MSRQCDFRMPNIFITSTYAVQCCTLAFAVSLSSVLSLEVFTQTVWNTTHFNAQFLTRTLLLILRHTFRKNRSTCELCGFEMLSAFPNSFSQQKPMQSNLGGQSR
jgi:hypothetical protein